MSVEKMTNMRYVSDEDDRGHAHDMLDDQHFSINEQQPFIATITTVHV